MSVWMRALRVVAIVWALAAVVGMGQAVRPSMEGQSMLADWAKSFGWLVGLQLHWSGNETPEGLRAFMEREIAQYRPIVDAAKIRVD